MRKFIFITGGVVSSLGKGISGASIARLLQYKGLSVNMVKCDPYINVDAGTMNPFQHGEVYVTDDGAETDLDLGYYERFLDINTTQASNITAGSVYQRVIERERKGEYLGSTVQVIPHITNEIKDRFKQCSKGYDVTVIEIGGTVGDIESLPFLEAARQFKQDMGQGNVAYVHVTLIPYIESSQELKTKPTQHSVTKLREIGIDPSIIICRTTKRLDNEIKSKIALFCSVPKESVIEAADMKSIYDVPLALHKQGVSERILNMLSLKAKKDDLHKWEDFVNKVNSAKKTVKVAVAGKYTQLKDAYKSIYEALNHGAIANGAKLEVDFVNVENEDLKQRLLDADGILIPGGFGERGIEGKLKAVSIAREYKKPFFGICLGMQCAVIEFARNVLGFQGANSSEFSTRTKYPVIDLMESQRSIKIKGGTMRLGAYTANLKPNSKVQKIYKKSSISERHRHRYEMIPKYVKHFEKKGLFVTGYYKELNLPEIIELKDHPWFVGVQYHPEFKSRPMKPHPLFQSFIEACLKNRKNDKK
jgi:CTP synthase